MTDLIQPRSLSTILREIQPLLPEGTITLGDFLTLFKDRGTAFIMFLIALPAALPVPAIGIFLIVAPPLLFLSFQQIMGRQIIWLPRWLQERHIKSSSFKNVISKAIPYVEKAEIISKPRLIFLTHGISTSIIGLMGFFMALSVLVPLPLTNTVPSLGIALMALGILMRDGIAVIVGAMIGLGWVLMLIILFLYFGSETVDVVKGFFHSFF